MPEFIHWQQAYQAENVQFIGIAIDDKQAVSDYLKTIPINYPILIAGDEGSPLSQQLGNIINAVPFTVIVNQAGQIVHRQPGELSKQQFLDVLQPLLSKKQ
jgi:alkyl hydroperoxide reductase subunit AhpC